jgi:hypothetical protein
MSIIPDNVQNQKAIKLEPCRCGSNTAKAGAGRKPQEASLHCSGCKRFIRWISVNELKGLPNKDEKIHIEQPDGSSIKIDRARRILQFSSRRGGGA